MKHLLGRYLTLFLVALVGIMPAAQAAQQTINRGTTAGDGQGETLYSAFGKVNSNFTDLYTNFAPLASPTFSGTITVNGTLTGTGFTSLLSPYLTSSTASATYTPLSQKGSANGIATLDSGSRLPAAQLPQRVYTVVGKAFVGTGLSFSGTGTDIPTSTNPVGDYTTKLIFQGVVRDDTGSLVDMANSRLVIPSSGYSECRIIYNLSWGVAGTSSFTANTTSGSNQLTSASSTASLSVGVPVSGTGIPTGAAVIGVSGTTVYLNIPASATGTGVTVTATNAAVGFRGMRVKNSAGTNYGNVRIPAILAANTTTNNNYTSPWITISTNSAPDSIAPGDNFTFWPAQTSGATQLAGADAASSFVQLECR